MQPKQLGINVTDFERKISEYRREQEKKFLRHCEHKETLLAESILEDESGLRYSVCPKCFRRLSILKGFKVIQQQGAETMELRKRQDRKANGLLPF